MSSKLSLSNRTEQYVQPRIDEEHRGNVSPRLLTDYWRLIGSLPGEEDGKALWAEGIEIGKDLVLHGTREKFDIVVEHRVYKREWEWLRLEWKLEPVRSLEWCTKELTLFFFFSVKTNEPRFLENLLGRVWKIDCKRERAKKKSNLLRGSRILL